jgi:hypothetical protein
MTDDGHDALADDLRALLSAERDRPDLSDASLDLAWRSLSASLDRGPSGEGGGDEGASEAGGDEPSAGGGGGAGAQGLASMFGAKTTALSLIVGAAIGFGIARTVAVPSDATPDPSAALPAAGTLDEPSAQGTVMSVDELPSLRSVSPVAPTAAAPVGPSPPGSTAVVKSTLKEERLLLERARAALLRQDPAGALAALAQHRAAFPNGQLADEREALHQQANDLDPGGTPASDE